MGLSSARKGSPLIPGREAALTVKRGGSERRAHSGEDTPAPLSNSPGSNQEVEKGVFWEGMRPATKKWRRRFLPEHTQKGVFWERNEAGSGR